MSNLTIIRGRPGSGKTTRLREIERDARAKGLTVAWIEGTATAAGAKRMIKSMRPDVVLYDEPEARPVSIGLVERLAESYPKISFVAVQGTS